MEAVRPKPKGKSKKKTKHHHMDRSRDKSSGKHKEKKQQKSTTEVKDAATKLEGATPDTCQHNEGAAVITDVEKDSVRHSPQEPINKSDNVVPKADMESEGSESRNEIMDTMVTEENKDVVDEEEVKSKPLPIIPEAPPNPALPEMNKPVSQENKTDIFVDASEELTEAVLSKERTSNLVNVSHKPELQEIAADLSSKNDVISAMPLSSDVITVAQSAVEKQGEVVHAIPAKNEQVQDSVSPIESKHHSVQVESQDQHVTQNEVVQTELTAKVDVDEDVKESAPALIDLSEQVRVVQVTSEVEEELSIHYPVLDSFNYLQEEEVMEDLVPFTEEDLALLYPNPQLDAQPHFVDNFIKHSNQERHELYELLMTYLKAKQTLTNTQKELETLQRDYETHKQLVWDAETRHISSVGKCGDGSKVTHSHSHKFAVFKSEPAVQVGIALKNIRQLLQEELCMRAYSSQLARVHVENYLFQLMHDFPEMMGMAENAPVTGWVPDCPPGGLDEHTSRLRDSISVLFMFLRKPVVDKEFSEDCRKWLDILLADLLRVSSLVDHQFIFNHLLRCPPGVGKWGTQYLQLLSPLQTRALLQEQYQSNAPLLGGFSDPSVAAGYSNYWGVGLGLHGDWGGPLLDHFVTMLATLLLPIKERESFLLLLNIPEQPAYSRAISQQWIFVEDMEEEETLDGEMLLKESDFISFFDQFPFTDLFQYILQISPDGEYSVEQTASHQILRLIAFCTCLIRLLGAAFSTLKMARYKEFIKQVGRTIRQTVQYVADHWMSYKAYRLQQGDHMAALPIEEGSRGEPRYSLNRLQLEFDQFVLRATRWILTAHKLGAWQFLADMPYGSVSLKTMWTIFWNIYCKQSSGEADDITSSQTGSTGSGSNNLENRVRSPTTMEGIQEAMKEGSFKDHFVDRLMKTYTSEAVFLLTTLVNIARARPSDSEEERELINTIVLEIFECTEVIEYARDTYSRTGCNLLDTIAIVHPFCISTLLGRVKNVVQTVGENCILLFKQLSLHLWVPKSHDVQLVFDWLTDYPLNSNENLLARVILGGLNWGTKSEDGSSELVLPWSLHCSVALKLVEAHSKHLPTQPGGRNFTPAVSGIGKYLDNKFGTSSDQQEYMKWAWDVVLMLKLHPSQVLSQSMETLNPVHQGRSGAFLSTGQNDTTDGPRERSHSEQRVALSSQQPSWIQLSPHSDELILPDLTSSSERELADLRDAVKYEGLLAYYVALCITSIGTDTDHFMASGLSMLNRLLDQGYYLPTLRVLANVTPRFFKHKKMLVEDPSFIHVVVAICNADLSNASLRERWTSTSPAPLVTKKMAALIQTQIQSAYGPGGVGGEAVLKFWLEILLSCPLWYRESSVLHLLDTLCMASFTEPSWQKILEETLLETYRLLDPVQPRKGLISSVYSSVASMVINTGGTPSLFNFIPADECPWLAYHALCAEQRYEDEEGIWKTLLMQLRNNSKASVDSALKKSFTELKMPGVFPATHLCIYRWAEFSTVLDHTHPLYPLIWQRFFVLYLQRPILDGSMPERESQGIRFFASSRSLSLRRQLKTSLSNTCKQLQASINAPESDDNDKRPFLSRCLKLYQTLRLWLEEPKLHSSALYLPGLPQQYDAQRLEATMKPMAKPWMEFVPIWEVKSQLNALTEEWVHVAAYQKTLPSKAFPPESSPDTAVTRIQKRLNKRQTPVPPPKFHYCSPPFVLLSADVLLSREALLGVVHSDFEYLKGQAMSFCTKADALPILDEQYMSGLPELYTNEPKQFHVRVPCHSRFNSSHKCQLPATIVFRFNEMTTSPRWEQQLKVNRSEYNEMVTGLSTPVSQDLCQIVMRIEHSVSELSRLASQSTETIPNIPLQCGIALFYQILQFITPETRQYPPTCQFLTSCLQILGQEFVQRDPMQTTNILDALIRQRGQSELLAPLFKPNLCPEQFLPMYSSAAEMAVREGPSIAFSVLTKFNIRSWLESYDPSMSERAQLLDFIGQGLALGGSVPNSEAEAIVEVYRHHFVQLLEHRFPEQYYDALQLVITGTDNANIVVSSWIDLCRFLGSPEHPEECKLGLQPIIETINVLSSHFHELRSTSGQSVYSLINKEYVPVISQFISSLCVAMVKKWMDAISMGTEKSEDAISKCWKALLDVFTPWVVALTNPDASENKVILPCSEAELEMMNLMLKVFVDCVALTHTTISDPNGLTSIMSLLFQYYSSSLAQADTPLYILSAYHTHFEQLPWRSYLPSLAALDSMMKLKLDHYPPSCFVFLGRVFPLFDWKTIVTAYCNVNEHGDSSAPVNFHIVFLQLLVMLAAEREVMERDDTGIPEVIAEAQTFQWEYIDAKTYQDVLNWQKNHYECTTILHTGSCLSLSLRLLKAAAGFQTCFTPEDSHYNDTWEKRLNYIQGMVELIGNASHTRETHSLSYSDPVTSLFQTVVDICVNEPAETGSANVISLLQEILNLLNICSSTGNMSTSITEIMVKILEELPDVHLIALPLITASCRTIVSHKHMTLVLEHSIEAHFKAISKPDSNTLALPPDPTYGYGWKFVTTALSLPEELVVEVCKACFEECAGLVLYAMLMQELPQCTSIEQEYRIGVKVVQWCIQMKPKQTQETKMFLLWEKALGLLMRQVRYAGKFSDLIPHFTTLANSMARFGEDKASEGILGAIGLGKKSRYSHQFRLVSRAMAAFILCQIPVNTNHTSQLRVIPNAPGHVKDITRNSQGSVITGLAISATKQGDQMCISLESMMTNKHYSHIKDHVSYAVAFVNNPTYCVMNCNELLVYLCTSLYPSYRYLDLLRVLQL